MCAKSFGGGLAQSPDRTAYLAGAGGLGGATLAAVLGGRGRYEALLSGDSQPLLLLGMDGFLCEVNQRGFPFGGQGASVLSVTGSLRGAAEARGDGGESVPQGGTTGRDGVLPVAWGGMPVCRAGHGGWPHRGESTTGRFGCCLRRAASSRRRCRTGRDEPAQG
ncbi:hypothetical protein GCM10010425_49300 [Streptomyces spororaveus]|uniref:Uncharacterized protein n=1 Tax=Streptomyces spororaveus TaxID=284039 RepID=A0ABQ3T2A6_9ACTN|nr:hypothetical protein Sspor_00850 [Streptomyces spororaveus]